MIVRSWCPMCGKTKLLFETEKGTGFSSMDWGDYRNYSWFSFKRETQSFLVKCVKCDAMKVISVMEAILW